MKDLFEGCDLKVTEGVLKAMGDHNRDLGQAEETSATSELMVLADTDKMVVCSSLDSDKLLCSTSESEADSSENEASTSTASMSPGSSKADLEVNNNVQMTHDKFDLAEKVKDDDDLIREETEDPAMPEVAKIEVTKYSMTSESGEVVIEVSGPEQWLCVARLPLDFTADEFGDLVGQFGSVERVQLIHSEKTGKTSRKQSTSLDIIHSKPNFSLKPSF